MYVLTGVKYRKSTAGAKQNTEATFNYNTVFLDVALTKLKSKIIYEITVQNSNKNVQKQISKINIDNDGDLEYQLSGYNIGDAISPNSTITFNITIMYSVLYKNNNNEITEPNRSVMLERLFEDTTAIDNGTTTNNYTIKNDDTTDNDLLTNNYTKN